MLSKKQEESRIKDRRDNRDWDYEKYLGNSRFFKIKLLADRDIRRFESRKA